MLDDPNDTHRLERRIRAVGSVKQAVQLIWLLARSQLPDVETAADRASEYVDWIERTVDRLAGPPIRPPTTNDTLHIVFGPERGYCGALIRNVVERLPEDGELAIVGRQIVERVSRDPARSNRVAFALSGPIVAEDHETVAYHVARAVLEHARATSVVVHYPTVTSAELEVEVLLSSRTMHRELPETFSPPRAVLDMALRELIMGQLAVAAIETLRAEVRARVAAAERARKGCDKRLEELNSDLRVARQAQITSELLEIAAHHIAGD